ncbi:MAG: FAD-dependent oxidoreductase [Anaerolineales bacterium]|nr:MAG: FAD-dependent oxidoreductase [Anaerolineales bacterium]
MNTENSSKYLVAVIGAGPAGLFAARQLATDGAQVVLLNRDIKPGGLAEYGIYPSKHKMKEGLRKQFRQILQTPQIEYFGNVTVGNNGDLTLSDLRAAGFQALLVTAGAQGTKWLGLPGEELARGVYHAKDIVYHYNKLPPYANQDFYIGRRVALIGVGNVMLDIARWLIRQLKVDQVTAIARRGPAEVKFDKKEMESVIANLDLQALDKEIARVAPVMESLSQDVEAAKTYILSAQPKAEEPVSATRFQLEFLASPTRILGDELGQVCGLEIEETTLIPRNGDTKAKGTGVKRVMDVDTVIFCIGDRVDEEFGLPVQWNEFVKSQDPQYPMDGLSYEAYNPEQGAPIRGVFVAGWSREASSGLVGVARKDGERGAKAVFQYLQSLPPTDSPEQKVLSFREKLHTLGKPIISKENITQLEAAERAEAEKKGLEEFKYGSNKEMLAILGLS